MAIGCLFAVAGSASAMFHARWARLGRSVSCDSRGGQASLTASFLIDGEAVVCRDDGLSDFDALHRRRATMR